jgi:hypothetical protein
MHEVTGDHWHEPEGLKNAGYGAWKQPNTPYDDYRVRQKAARLNHAPFGAPPPLMRRPVREQLGQSSGRE